MSSNYETLYGVGLLDDLHNYFPALLYDSSSFVNVQDVLRYIQQQTRNRFDLFSYGQREYLSTNPLPSRPASASENPVFRRVVRTSFAGMPAPQGPSLSTLLRPTLNTNLQVQLSQINAPDEEEEEENDNAQVDNTITNALLSLLQIPTTTLTRNYTLTGAGMENFLQPIVVRPTADQIAANTTLGNLVSDTDHSCAICQDVLTAEQEGRKLNACGHWFHKSCIDTWFQRDVHCPVCRHDIREPHVQH